MSEQAASNRGGKNGRFFAPLLLALAGCFGAPSQPAKPPPPPDAALLPAPPPEREAVVAAAEGKVERLRAGDWLSLKVGDHVRAQDALRTGPKARIDLEIDAAAHITVAEETQLGVAALTEAVHRFNLKSGRVSAEYAESGERLLRIEGERGEVAEAKGAHFSVLAGEKSFAVAARTGTVNLRAAQGSVTVGQGEKSVVLVGQAPSPAAPIPVELLLKVAGAGTRKAEGCAVEGATDPGSVVLIDEVVAEVGPDGRFAAEPKPGASGKVRVVTHDALGRSKQLELACPAKGPKAQPVDAVQIRWRE